MKLGKLLAAGKSIMNGHTEVAYRSSKQIYLPKFGSPKNPFKPESAEQSVETTPSAAIDLRASASGSETIARAVAGTARLADGNTTVSAAFSGPIGDARAVSVAGAKEAPQLVNRSSDSTLLPRRSNLPYQSEVAGEAKAGQRFGTAKYSSNNAPAANPQPAVQTARIPQLSKFNPFMILRGALPGGKAKNSVNSAKGQKGTPTQTELSLDAVRVVHNDLSDVDVEVVPIKSRSAVPELPAPKNSWEFVGERLFGVEAT